MNSKPNANEPQSQRKRLSSDERREQLLGCALSAYASLGVERAGHGDVAKIAGVSTATVFNYFSTRKILSEAVFNLIREKFLDLFLARPSEVTSASNQVRKFAEAYASFTETHPDTIKVLLNWSVAFGPDVRPQYLAFRDSVLDRISDRLPGHREGRSDARLVWAAAHAFAQMKLDNTAPDTIERFVDRLADALS